jgi:chromatin structure-remodeling complex subunit SFH1
MSTIVQGATTTYASRIRTGNTPLLVPSPATVAKQRSVITGTPLAPAPTLQARPSFRSNSRMNDDDDDDDEDNEFLDIESDEGKKDKEEDGLVEESGGFVLGPPPDALIQRRNAVPTKHHYRYFWAWKLGY